MKAEDLRIENLINLTKDNFKTVKVYQLDGFDIYKLSESECIDIEPIPLTEEWLLKFGFDEHTIKGSYNIGEFRFHTQRPFAKDDKFTLVTEIHWCGRHTPIVGGIKHVHQLQNLYHALTGKELIYDK